jgi:hypothetical protein
MFCPPVLLKSLFYLSSLLYQYSQALTVYQTQKTLTSTAKGVRQTTHDKRQTIDGIRQTDKDNRQTTKAKGRHILGHLEALDTLPSGRILLRHLQYPKGTTGTTLS